jgi:hypothetical protein
MSDRLATAFGRTPLPAVTPDFERRVVTRASSTAPTRLRRIRGVLRAYWIAAGAISVGVIAASETSAWVFVGGAASLASVAAGAVIAAGGVRRITRVLRATVA